MTDHNPPVPPAPGPGKPICVVQAFLNEVETARKELSQASAVVDALKSGRPASISVHASGWGSSIALSVPADVLISAAEGVRAARRCRLTRMEETHRQLTQLLEGR